MIPPCSARFSMKPNEPDCWDAMDFGLALPACWMGFTNGPWRRGDTTQALRKTSHCRGSSSITPTDPFETGSPARFFASCSSRSHSGSLQWPTSSQKWRVILHPSLADAALAASSQLKSSPTGQISHGVGRGLRAEEVESRRETRVWLPPRRSEKLICGGYIIETPPGT